ncbi:MAG: alpha/beta hydrolase [Elusimicrobiota bacterium]
MIVWAGAILLLVAVMLAVCWWGSGIILHPPKMSPMAVFPEQFGLRYERFTCTTADGLTLKGWFIPSKTGDKRTVLMCHGWGDNKGELLKQTHFLNETGGFNLVYFDFRSHGESQGNITTIGGQETIDFNAAVSWLKNSKPEYSKAIGVFGLSMGAAVTCVSMPKHPELRCAVVESPFSHYQDLVRRWAWEELHVPYFPMIAITLLFLRLRVGDPLVDSFHPVESVAHIAPRPLLIIAGSMDKLMPPHDVRRVHNAAGRPKQLWMIEGAPHAKCHETAGLEYETRVTDFFQHNL